MGLFTRKKKESVPEGRPVPRHIAVIMDGNGRWAKKRGLPRKAGHKVGAETFRTIATYCKDIGVQYFTGWMLFSPRTGSVRRTRWTR